MMVRYLERANEACSEGASNSGHLWYEVLTLLSQDLTGKPWRASE